MQKIQVICVEEPPAIGKVEMCQGIRSKDAAQAWAAKHGYPTVYWLVKRERVYADKRSRIDLEAARMKAKSQELLQFSENGAGLLEYLLLAAFLVSLFVCLAGIPW